MNIEVHLTAKVNLLRAREKGNRCHGKDAIEWLRPLQVLHEAYPAVCAEERITRTSDSRTENEGGTLVNPQEHTGGLDRRLARYRRVLLFLADRLLRNHKDAEDAVRNCLSSASLNLPRCEDEGAFRSWLVRILMDEALLILHKKRNWIE